MTIQDAIMPEDPFATADTLKAPSTDPEEIRGGRYRLPDLTIGDAGELITGDGPRTGGWQRVTTLVKAIGDARALDLWHQRELIKGMVLRPDLYDLACAVMSTTTDPGALRRDLEALGEKILAAAGADIGRNLGTAFHGFTEAQDAGMMVYARRQWHGKLANYGDGLKAQGLQVQRHLIERKIVVLRYGLAGTLDRILKDLVTNGLEIADLKTQKTFWTWTEISAQLAAYAMADAMWDRAELCYVEMPPVSQETAIVSWMPVAHPAALESGQEADADGVDFFQVDLERGRARLEECYRVDRIRSEDRSKYQTLGLLRPQPGLALVEAYAARLDSVASAQEGSALWAEVAAQGLATVPELEELAREVAQRFLSPQ
jgi:hypothetical protein